jgi:hypothetical protein
MVSAAIRRTLDHELSSIRRCCSAKYRAGAVHAVTLGLPGQAWIGNRCSDTSLSGEELSGALSG